MGHPDLWQEFSEIIGDIRIEELELEKVCATTKCQWKQRQEDSFICEN